MASDNTWLYIIGGVAGILGLSAVASAGGKKRRTVKSFYTPGETVHAFMGQLITVRLPRGDYQVVSDQAIEMVQKDVGSSTDIALQIQSSHSGYTDKVRFIELGPQGRTFYVDLIVTQLPEA